MEIKNILFYAGALSVLYSFLIGPGAMRIYHGELHNTPVVKEYRETKENIQNILKVSTTDDAKKITEELNEFVEFKHDPVVQEYIKKEALHTRINLGTALGGLAAVIFFYPRRREEKKEQKTKTPGE